MSDSASVSCQRAYLGKAAEDITAAGQKVRNALDELRMAAAHQRLEAVKADLEGGDEDDDGEEELVLELLPEEGTPDETAQPPAAAAAEDGDFEGLFAQALQALAALQEWVGKRAAALPQEEA